ncbi:hypothetical protein QZH41_004600 [Actinostola sp. cb2023]|nr:hypothetical protein QZH41_004600 [Actinostola sp. cb2023]
MVLVPEEFMDMLERKENMQTVPTTKYLIRLDKKMEDNLHDTKKPADDKIAQYNQNLQRFLEVQEQKRQFIPTVKIHQENASTSSQENKEEGERRDIKPQTEQSDQHPLTGNEILESIPKSSRTLAQSMINRLKANSDHVSWNDKGEVTINENPIPGSNIIDLINDQLRSRKNVDPKGWERFTESLDKINMPKYLLRNEKHRSHIVQMHKKESRYTPFIPKEPAKMTDENYIYPPTPPTTPRMRGKNPSLKRFDFAIRFGEEVSDIFETLPDQGEDKDYKAAVAALNVYFQPKVNKTYEVYMFRNATQDSGESLDSYYTRLRRLAQTCEFTNEEEEIKSHIILSCSSTRLRRRALREYMNLKALLDYGRGFEMSEQQAKGIEEHEKLCKATEVQMVKPRNVRTKTDQKQCYRCGGNYPHQGRPCPALHETCRNCQKVGNFAKVCENKGHPVSEVTIGNKTVKCLIDSGAGVNVIDSHTYNKLNIPLSPTSKKIYSYQATKPLPVLGKFEADVISAVTNTSNIAQFYVVDGADGNLLGYKKATDLRLLHIVNTLSTPKGTSIVDEYSDCFKGLGKMKDKTAQLHIDSSVKPLAQRHRRVPFHMRDQVEAELKNLQDLDIIERAEGPTPWVSPIVIVPKKVGIRICVDMRAANEAIERERHPVPTVEDLIVDLNGSTVFSKIDLNQGYHQLELDADSRNITTFATHLGLFRYKRLSFGINSASEIFQKAIEEAVQGIEGARNISDDIIVFGKQQDDHDNALRAVLQRMRDNNLTANPDKCLFNQSSIDFFGHHFSSEGISADDKKISSLINSSHPKNANEARSLLGFAQYLARFIKDFASISAPIRQLTHKDAKWVWGPDQQHAFASLKASMAAPEVMKYFDPLLKTELIVDASPVGLGAILAQVTRDQGRNVVAYASRSLTDCESRYSQTEREALAVVWGTEHFHLYIHGSSFQAITDHKPLETIFNKSTCKATARLERLQLRLQPYKITVVYRPGADNPADYMSRHPDPKHTTSPNHLSRVDSYVNFVTANAVPNAVTLQEIQDATAKDHTLQNLAKVIATQRWYEAGRDVREYQQVKQELTVANGVILRGTRIIVPETLRQRMIMLAHSVHQGIVKTKRLLRDSVWFPGIDGMVEEMINQCLPCQAANHNSRPACEPLKMSPLPQGPWQELSIYFCGPFPNGDYLLVVVDYFSRFPEIEILRSTSAKAVIPHLDSIFARQGIPDVVRTDNGPPFNSENFQMFATHLGFNHRKITPIWPRANGEAERLMRTLEKAIRTAVIEHKSWRQELFTFLRQYRATPHSTTGKSPSELLNGRKLKSTMPRLQQDQASPEVKQNDAKRKEQMKEYADRHNHARASDLKVGDKVLVKQPKKNKMSTPFKPEPLEVKEKKGSMIQLTTQSTL